mgnify:CR=1
MTGSLELRGKFNNKSKFDFIGLIIDTMPELLNKSSLIKVLIDVQV